MLGARLRGHVPPATTAAIAVRGGGWRGTGRLARAALCVAGLVCGAHVTGIWFVAEGRGLLVPAIAVLAAAELLLRSRRLHASGIEEGLFTCGCGLAALWLVETLPGAPRSEALVAAAAFGLAGLRLLNPLLTTLAAACFVQWLGSTLPAAAVDRVVGPGSTSVVVACAIALAALAAGSRTFLRPSHDRMLDWLVAVLPAATYLLSAPHAWVSGGLVPPVADAMSATGFAGGVPVAVALPVYAAAALIVGLRRRRHAPLLGALSSLACLYLEACARVGGPAEAWLIAGGLLVVGAGVAVERWLRTPRAGFTSAPLDARDGPLDLLQMAGSAALAQRAAVDARSRDDGFHGGGGRHGGGGASGSY